MPAKNTGGANLFARVYETIDGARDVKGHGTRDMPIRDNDCTLAAVDCMDAPDDTDAPVRARILALTEHLCRMQAK